jgi:hypothetical protein
LIQAIKSDEELLAYQQSLLPDCHLLCDAIRSNIANDQRAIADKRRDLAACRNQRPVADATCEAGFLNLSGQCEPAIPAAATVARQKAHAVAANEISDCEALAQLMHEVVAVAV